MRRGCYNNLTAQIEEGKPHKVPIRRNEFTSSVMKAYWFDNLPVGSTKKTHLYAIVVSTYRAI